MVSSDNVAFDKVYNKLTNVIEKKTKALILNRKLGRQIDNHVVKQLNLYIRYLDSVKYSKYKYFTVAGLNNISNLLNTL